MHPDTSQQAYIGIDLGGTKIEIIVLDQTGKTLLRERTSTPKGNYTATLDAISSLVENAENRLGITGSVGIGIPGTISTDTGLVKNANSTCLIGKPLDQDLSEKLNREIRIANDANCFALSEVVDGAAAGAMNVFGVIIGTGTGGGIVVNKQVLTGVNHISGEWGHNPLPWMTDEDYPAQNCYCGKQGCIETWLSGPGFEKHFLHKTGKQLSSQEIAGLASKGDKECEQQLENYCERLAKSLASVINILDPEVIVLGGGMSNIELLYEKVPEFLPEYVFSDFVHTRIVKAQHGDSSGVRGAAWLWKEWNTQ